MQGEIIARTLNPSYWGDLWSTRWGRSELASQLYDEILFNGATFGDLDRGTGPWILASATDISTGGRFVFNQNTFDVLCSDLNAVRLSRAAAASGDRCADRPLFVRSLRVTERHGVAVADLAAHS